VLDLEVAPVAPRWIESSPGNSPGNSPGSSPGNSPGCSMSPGALRQLAGSVPAARPRELELEVDVTGSSPAARPR